MHSSKLNCIHFISVVDNFVFQNYYLKKYISSEIQNMLEISKTMLEWPGKNK